MNIQNHNSSNYICFLFDVTESTCIQTYVWYTQMVTKMKVRRKPNHRILAFKAYVHGIEVWESMIKLTRVKVYHSRCLLRSMSMLSHLVCTHTSIHTYEMWFSRLFFDWILFTNWYVNVNVDMVVFRLLSWPSTI